jgi:hypothetical protein
MAIPRLVVPARRKDGNCGNIGCLAHADLIERNEAAMTEWRDEAERQKCEGGGFR